MRVQNGRLVALVAAVAVGAIASGGALAYRQGPQTAEAEAAPLSTSPSPVTSNPTTAKPATAKPTPTPSKTPTPSSTPPAGPLKTKVVLDKLPTGRAPQIAYLTGRTIPAAPAGTSRSRAPPTSRRSPGSVRRPSRWSPRATAPRC